jgi:protein-tyrosine-phosphatase
VTSSWPEQPFTVLLVCTGNICRSPLAERLGRAYLAERLGERAGTFRLISAGTGAVVDSAMHPGSALVLQGYGAQAGDFRARQFVEAMAHDADLVLTMARRHRQEVLERAPRTLQRTFTLREAADLLGMLDDDFEPDGETPAEQARGLVQALARARSRRKAGEADDVPDPIRGPIEAHEEAGELIVAALLPLLRRLAQLVPVGSPGSVGVVGQAIVPASEESGAAHRT